MLRRGPCAIFVLPIGSWTTPSDNLFFFDTELPSNSSFRPMVPLGDAAEPRLNPWTNCADSWPGLVALTRFHWFALVIRTAWLLPTPLSSPRVLTTHSMLRWRAVPGLFSEFFRLLLLRRVWAASGERGRAFLPVVFFSDAPTLAWLAGSG